MIDISQAVREQLTNPRHCLLLLIPERKGRKREVEPPRFFRHSSDLKDDKLGPMSTIHCKGKPVRFTRLAGESMLAWAKRSGFAEAKLVEIEEES